MVRTIGSQVRGRGRRPVPVRMISLFLLVVCLAAPAAAVMDIGNPVIEMGYNPNGIFILDGSYVMNVGEVQINITNWGLIGSMYSSATQWSDAPSCQWPAGSGDEYLWAAGLWVGGVVLGERLVSTGGWGSEIYPQDELESTIYEAIDGALMRPVGNIEASGARAPTPGPDDDNDDLVDEEILNGKDDDEDGKIDEDFAQIGNQMMVLTNYDNTRLAQENFPDHTPMNLEIVQQSYQWENDQVDDFVGFEYTITNVGVTDIDRVYIGFFADSDISKRGEGGGADDDMAGSWPDNHGDPGLVRASDGSFVPIQVGYMYDAAETGRMEGYFGIVFLGHDIDPTGQRAPTSVGMRSYQAFAGNSSFEQGGDPTNDDERYQLLSAPREEWDNNTLPGKQNDFRFLVSAGPFKVLAPSENLKFQVGMVCGPGLGNDTGGPGLLANCAEAALTWYGIFVDEITAVVTETNIELNPGQLGRETMLCKQDFESPSGGENPFDNFIPDYMDTTCLDAEWVLNQQRITDDDIFDYEVDGEIKQCAMFNLDNCFECARQLGFLCGPQDFIEERWKCNDPDALSYAGCTGVEGLETQLHWLVGMAPPPPGLRLWAADSRVHIYWDDVSETTNDIRLQRIDFESYRIWRADNWDRPFGSSLVNGPESSLWQLIGEFDRESYFITHRDVDNVTYLDTIPLGANTGLDPIRYTPKCLSDPRFAGLAEAMQEIVDNDPGYEIRTRPVLRDENGVEIPEFSGLIPWEYYPDVLDTFFAVAEREENLAEDVIGKDAVRFYEYIDREIHNGFIYFYSVTASDMAMLPEENDWDIGPQWGVGPGLVGDPGSSFSHTVPGAKSQTAAERERDGVNIYVFPNPATRDALHEYQELFPNGDDPTGVRVTFTNLPAARNTISIYTVSGDLVQTIHHDGSGGVGHTSWNLMSRNGQEIVSGVYLYSVQADDDRFEDYVGKFVVVR